MKGSNETQIPSLVCLSEWKPSEVEVRVFQRGVDAEHVDDAELTRS